VPIGIVPLGTGNLLARNLGIPLNATEAVEVAMSGQDRAVDVVEFGGDGLETAASWSWPASGWTPRSCRARRPS
jgi:diacylglycerol kinase family enzyme